MPEFRRLRHEVAVRRGADPDGEEAGVAEALSDDAEELRLVPHAAVGQEDDLPHEPRVVAADEGGLEGRPHLGPALRGEARHPAPGQVDRARPDRLRRGEEAVGGAVELDHVEALAGAETVEGEEERPAGLLDREPVHRPGGVDDVHDLARGRRLLSTAGPVGGKSVTRAYRAPSRSSSNTALRGMASSRGLQASSKSRSAGTRGLRSRTRKRRSPRASVRTAWCRLRIRLDGEARVEVDLDPHRVVERLRGRPHRGRDVRGVGDPIGVGRPPAAVVDGGHRVGRGCSGGRPPAGSGAAPRPRRSGASAAARSRPRSPRRGRRWPPGW